MRRASEQRDLEHREGERERRFLGEHGAHLGELGGRPRVEGPPERAHFAGGRDFRTSPLWAVGVTNVVSMHNRLLHDGRARNIEEAILWHGGEADAPREAFRALEAGDRAAILRFVASL